MKKKEAKRKKKPNNNNKNPMMMGNHREKISKHIRIIKLQNSRSSIVKKKKVKCPLELLKRWPWRILSVSKILSDFLYGHKWFIHISFFVFTWGDHIYPSNDKNNIFSVLTICLVLSKYAHINSFNFYKKTKSLGNRYSYVHSRDEKTEARNVTHPTLYS